MLKKSFLLSSASVLCLAVGLGSIAQAANLVSQSGTTVTATPGATYENTGTADNQSAIYVEGTNSVVNGDRLTIKNTLPGVSVATVKVNGGGKLNLTNSNINSEANGILAVDSSVILQNVNIVANAKNGIGVRLYGASTSLINGSSILVKGYGASALNLSEHNGVGANATVTNTRIVAEGVGAAGIELIGMKGSHNVSLTNSSVVVEKGIGISFTSRKDGVVSLKDSSINAQQLISASYGSAGSQPTLTVNADNTQLSGGAYINGKGDNKPFVDVNLTNNSIWTVGLPMNGLASEVSNLLLDNSTLQFASPVVDVNGNDKYHTLKVSGLALRNNANIEINTYLNGGGALNNQKTDRLLVNGDVTGQAIVTVNAVKGSPGVLTEDTATAGISIIQVSGSASEDSFKLKGGYVTLDGTAYRYTLRAYGPGASNGAASDDQRLVAGTGDYWDYRLQNRNSDIVAQATSYLVTPTLLFQAGLVDLGSLHQRLGEIRTGKTDGATQINGDFFMRAYGGTYDYSSNLSTRQNGYDADMDYKAMQAGVNLYTLETKQGVARFGLSGSYGEMSFQPKHVADTNKNDIDKWTVSAYATYQGYSGVYVDGIVSYGRFNGDISTALRGKTARLKGDTFSASIETGVPLETGLAGLVIEPQAQLVYQRLMFDRTQDVDNFRVDLGDQQQVTARMGARLTKTLQTSEQGKVISFYGKVNVLHSFNEGGTVNMGSDFRLGDFGSAVEGGLGINAQLSKNLSIYGDAAYQNKIEKAGISGATFNGGLRYQF